MHTKQKFLQPDTSIHATRFTIQRTRKQCAYWGKKQGNGNLAVCGLKKKHCRPAVCNTFLAR